MDLTWPQLIAVALGGWTAFAALAGWQARAVATSRWIPGVQHEREIGDKQQQIDRAEREAETWRQAFQTSEESRARLADGFRENTEAVRLMAHASDTTLAVIRAALPAPEGKREDA